EIHMGHCRVIHRFDGGGCGAVDDVRGLEPPCIACRRFEHAAEGRDVELLLLFRLPAEDGYPRHLLREWVDIDDPPTVPFWDMAQDAARARAVRVHIKEGFA